MGDSSAHEEFEEDCESDEESDDESDYSARNYRIDGTWSESDDESDYEYELDQVRRANDATVGLIAWGKRHWPE